jgi:uncharacterized membrane protein
MDDHGTHRQAMAASTGLGWFSVALGLAEMMAPRDVARAAGINPHPRITSALRLAGARELAAGIAILSHPDRPGPLWARVAGDAADLTMLAVAHRSHGFDAGRGLAATAAVLAITALDVATAQQLAATGQTEPRRSDVIDVTSSVTVNRPIEEVYRFWRNLTNLPGFMAHLEEVRVIDDRRSHWRAKAPAGLSVEWDAELVVDREQERLSWQSLPGSTIQNSGSVMFSRAPGARGTEVRVQLRYSPPAGRAGAAIARLFGEEPAQQVRDDLRRFKQRMETGEVPVSDGPAMWRAAQPAAAPAAGPRLTGVRA